MLISICRDNHAPNNLVRNLRPIQVNFSYLIATCVLKQVAPPSGQRTPHTTIAKTRFLHQNTLTPTLIDSATYLTSPTPLNWTFRAKFQSYVGYLRSLTDHNVPNFGLALQSVFISSIFDIWSYLYLILQPFRFNILKYKINIFWISE